LVEESDLIGQVLGKPPGAPYRDPLGTVTYTASSKNPVTVASENLRFVSIDGVAHQGSAAR